MTMQLEDFYKQKANFYKQQLAEITKKLKLLVVLRVVLFVMAWVGLIAFWDIQLWMAWSSFFVFMVAFLILVKIFERKKYRKNFFQLLIEQNQNELIALGGKISQFPNGEQFIDGQHPYAYDFDLFGNNSVFQWINRSYLPQTQETLAQKLKTECLNEASIINNQQAIEELSHMVDFRQKLHAQNQLLATQNNTIQLLLNWAKNPQKTIKSTITQAAIWFFPIAMFLVLGFHVAGFLSTAKAVLLYLIPLVFTGAYLKTINAQYGSLSKVIEGLSALEKSLIKIEKISFKAPQNQAIQAKLKKPIASSQAVKELKKIAGSFDQRTNLLVGIFLNVFLLWDIRLALKFEAWKKQFGLQIFNWVDALAQLEYLSCLANNKFNHPQHTFGIINSNYIMDAENLGHPLIFEHSVKNNISVNLQNHMVILTGANMAGKSTFLRTVGVNLILAMMGAAVVAHKFSFTPIHIYSGMRTNDSLQENASYFFAELKRLSAIIQQLKNGEKIFVILDEILKGTNSKDKEEGSIQLIHHLLKLGAGGIIATHDLGLCALEKQLPNQITNYAFETEIKNNELYFDYQIKKGVCQTMNASFLMQKMGITNQQ